MGFHQKSNKITDNMNLHSFIRRALFACRQFVLPSKAMGRDASLIIEKLLESSRPCMIARFGSAEIQGVISGILPPPPLIYVYKTESIGILLIMPDFSL